VLGAGAVVALDEHAATTIAAAASTDESL